MHTDPAAAAADMNTYFKRYPWFGGLSAAVTTDVVAITGYVLETRHKLQALAYAQAGWPKLICNVSVAFHLLVLYHLLVDSALLLVAGWLMHLLPEDDILLWFFHQFGTLIVFGFLLVHLAYVMYENLRHH